MHRFARALLVAGLIALPAVAVADGGGAAPGGRMQPPPPPPPGTVTPPGGAPPTGTPPTGPAGAPPTGTPPTGAPPTGAPPTGAPPTGAPPTGAPPTGAPPAQPQPVMRPKRTTVGADLTVVLPLGDYADGANLGIGGLLRIEYTATPQVGISLRGGYLWHATESGAPDLSMVPILVGGRYKLAGGPFAYGEVGINVIRRTYEIMGFTGTDGETYFSFGAGGGYAAGKFQARFGFWMPGRPQNGNSKTTLIGVLGSAGFDFNAF